MTIAAGDLIERFHIVMPGPDSSNARHSGLGLKGVPSNWLPPGKTAAVVFTIDDIHPGTSRDAYEAGGDLADGQFRFLLRLLAQHPQLRATLFATADWRATYPSLSRPLLMRIPFLRDLWCDLNTLPKGTMRLDKFPDFVDFLKNLPRVEIGLHGLSHMRRGHPSHVEYLTASETECQQSLTSIVEIFQRAGLRFVPGMSPPGWNLSPALANAMKHACLTFVGAARDLNTPIRAKAMSHMSGITGVSLLEPEWVYGGLLNFTTNYQATSSLARAEAILEHGGLLAVKAHIIKRAGSYVALDGLDDRYCDQLHVLFDRLESLGSGLWWTTMGEIAANCVAAAVSGNATFSVASQ